MNAQVSTIIPHLENAATVADVRRIVHEEFLHWFDGEEALAPNPRAAALRKRFGNYKLLGRFAHQAVLLVVINFFAVAKERYTAHPVANPQAAAAVRREGGDVRRRQSRVSTGKRV